MAVRKPDILELLVKKASVEQLVQQVVTKYADNTLLGLSMALSSKICKTPESGDGSSCPCVASVNIILAANYPIIPYRDFWQSWWVNTFARASMHCKTLVADQLRMRRRRLRQLAEEKLLHSEFAPFSSLAVELDFQAIDLNRLLSRKGLIEFGSLSTTLPDGISGISTGEQRFRPIYLDISNSEDASIFWDFGFRDMEEAWEYQWPFKYNPQIDHAGCSTLLSRVEGRYVIWLHDHCPSIWRWISEDHSPKGLAFILADVIGFSTYFNYKVHTEDESIAVDLLTTEITDDCACQCSPGGCTPFDTRMKWLAFRSRIFGPGIKHGCQSYVEDYGKKLTLNQHLIMVRQATFEALDMRHTCFNAPDWYQLEKPEDIEFEIETQDVDKARCLDDLVMGFREFVLNDDKVAGYEAGYEAGKDGQHPQNDGTVIHRRAIEYWGEVWLSRVHEIEEILAVTWNPDYQVFGDLGVSLQLESDDDDDEDAQTFTSEEERDYLFDKFMEDLEMIK
ncbi:hypothetical protein NW762_010572 [Fusarium torreyae]|uniref:Uncharacterized protein n=1 Tax=Fusarium torreyae TaxID=1237075 RepID=A0A9W8RU88_9HYPO|nr:hypothetical protein NW762_010572 [Fusarium torreyae]